MTIEARLQRIEDIESIRLLKAQYCDLCDEGHDADVLCTLFTPNAVWHRGSNLPGGKVRRHSRRWQGV